MSAWDREAVYLTLDYERQLALSLMDAAKENNIKLRLENKELLIENARLNKMLDLYRNSNE